MDLVVRTERMPGPGENVFGKDFRTIPGGKGANQAVAVARLGAESVFVGKVGDDDFGPALVQRLRECGVDTSHVWVDDDSPTGTAVIIINKDGQNSIVVTPGANGRVTLSEIDAIENDLQRLDMLLMQLEIPIETVVHVIRRAKAWGVPVILDAGPPCSDPPDELFQVAVLSPNEDEAAALLGCTIGSLEDAESAAREMLSRGAGAVVLKLGEKGAMLATEEECLHVEAHKVNVVDTTAAGDAFTGALAVALAEGRSLRDATIMANKAGALATTKLGAQPSMPTREALHAVTDEVACRRHGKS